MRRNWTGQPRCHQGETRQMRRPTTKQPIGATVISGCLLQSEVRTSVDLDLGDHSLTVCLSNDQRALAWCLGPGAFALRSIGVRIGTAARLPQRSARSQKSLVSSLLSDSSLPADILGLVLCRQAVRRTEPYGSELLILKVCGQELRQTLALKQKRFRGAGD
jgi:hypothetical protein